MRFADRRAEFNRLVINRAVRPLSGRVVLSGKTFEVRDPRIVPTDEAVSLRLRIGLHLQVQASRDRAGSLAPLARRQTE